MSPLLHTYKNSKDEDGRTLLILAAGYNKKDIVRILIDTGAELNEQESHGLTALHWAAVEGYPEICKMLVDAGARTDIKDKKIAHLLNLLRKKVQ
jgi:ankyrin repeat protein